MTTISKQTKYTIYAVLFCVFIILVSILNYLKEQKQKPFMPKKEHYKADKILQNITETNIRLTGDGNLLIYKGSPVMPYLVKCRNSKEEKEICGEVFRRYPHLKPTSP